MIRLEGITKQYKKMTAVHDISLTIEKGEIFGIEGMFFENRFVQQVAGTIVNIIRSIPFIILLVVLIPFTKLILGTSMGPTAASVSLTVAAMSLSSIYGSSPHL